MEEEEEKEEEEETGLQSRRLTHPPPCLPGDKIRTQPLLNPFSLRARTLLKQPCPRPDTGFGAPSEKGGFGLNSKRGSDDEGDLNYLINMVSTYDFFWGACMTMYDDDI